MRKSAYKRNSKGVQLIEVAASAVALTVMTILCIDACIVVLGFMFNDAACRDAARAASQASTSSAALSIAKTTVAAHKGDGLFWSTPVITNSDVEFQDFGGKITATDVPYVTVTTNCAIKMPAPLFFLGSNLKPDGSFNSTCHYTFPLTNITLTIPGESQN